MWEDEHQSNSGPASECFALKLLLYAMKLFVLKLGIPFAI